MPGPSPFAGLDVVAAPGMLIALGGRLDPPTLTAAYRAGCFPWPGALGPPWGRPRLVRRQVRQVPRLDGPDTDVPWCSPDPRAVLVPGALTLPRSLRRTLRRCGWTTTLDAAFADVVAACAAPAPGREETWITDRMRQSYVALHEQGGAHSVEVWDGERLVGGLYGVLTGQVFSGESMFHRQSDASKVALVDLAARLDEGGVVLLDTQQPSAHLAALGQVAISRADYLAVLHAHRDAPACLPAGRLPVERLA